jgi:hypothetical protein
MKVLFIILLNLSFIILKSQPSFYDRVTSDFNRHSYFLLLKTEDNKCYIIENARLYFLLHDIKGYTKEQYINEIKSLLINKKKFNLLNLNSEFSQVPDIIEVIENYKKGLSEFIYIYFNDNFILKDSISDDEKLLIIKILFENGILTKIDCETGYLIISN